MVIELIADVIFYIVGWSTALYGCQIKVSQIEVCTQYSISNWLPFLKVLTFSFEIMRAIAFEWWLSFLEYRMVVLLLTTCLPKPVHLHSLMPKVWMVQGCHSYTQPPTWRERVGGRYDYAEM